MRLFDVEDFLIKYIKQYFYAVGVVLPVGERQKGKLTSSKKNKK